LQLRANDGFRAEQIAYWFQLRPRHSTRSRWNLFDYLRARYGHAL